MIIQSGKKEFEWKKRGSRWLSACMITRGCTGRMSIKRGEMIARCPKCGRSAPVNLDRGIQQ